MVLLLSTYGIFCTYRHLFVCWHKGQLSNCFSFTSVTCQAPLIKILGGTVQQHILAFLLDRSYY
jgi:hypothetical protein